MGNVGQHRRWVNYWRWLGVALVLAMVPLVGLPQQPAQADHETEIALPGHLQVVREALKQHIDPNAEHRAWEVTEGNALDENWLIETPDCWGAEFASCASPDDTRTEGTQQFLAAIKSDLGNATASVDISTLLHCGALSCPENENGENFGFPTGAFHTAIVEGLGDAAKRKSPPEKIQVRILAGKPSSRNFDIGNAGQYLELLTGDLQQYFGDDDEESIDRLEITVMIQATAATSWNHSKIIAVDGKTAIVGGQNLWADDYDGPNPVADVTMRVRGSAAESAQLYLDELWGSRTRIGVQPCAGFYTASTQNDFECPVSHTKVDESSPGDVKVLSVGSRGVRMVPEFGAGASDKEFNETLCPGATTNRGYLRQNPDLLALWTLIETANESVYISAQQLNSFVCSEDDELFDILAKKLFDDVKVRIVVTGHDAADYTQSDQVWLPEIIEPLLGRQVPGETEELSAEQLCANLQLAPLRHQFGSHTWSNGEAVRNHAKVVMVDEAAFYIGSRNLYLAELQEFGYMIEDDDAARDLVDEYFDPMWTASKSAATVDAEQEVCNLGPTEHVLIPFFDSGLPATVTAAGTGGEMLATVDKVVDHNHPSKPVISAKILEYPVHNFGAAVEYTVSGAQISERGASGNLFDVLIGPFGDEGRRCFHVTGLTADGTEYSSEHKCGTPKVGSNQITAINRDPANDERVNYHQINGTDPMARPTGGNMVIKTNKPWSFDIVDWNGDGHDDWVGFRHQGDTGTGIKSTEIHVRNGIKEEWLLQTATALEWTDQWNWSLHIADWNGNGSHDMVAVKQGGGSSTEVHVIDTNNPMVFASHNATALPPTKGEPWDFDTADWNGDGHVDVVAVRQRGAASTELHVLNGKNLQQFLLQKATAIPRTDSNWDFEVSDWNGDDRPDLVGLNRNGSSSTELKVVDGTQPSRVLADSPTSLPKTNHHWTFVVSD